ncbi:MAG TPA: hypothetical protein VFT43_04815 [Candidatus Polarisedimenticolia bacterium]|nr:hypothetical protein [Candidatus Polarisedimenticolia bacterium]
MSKLFTFTGATVGSAIGWWVGDFIGLMTAFVLSMVGTAAGFYFGGRLARRYFE